MPPQGWTPWFAVLWVHEACGLAFRHGLVQNLPVGYWGRSAPRLQWAWQQPTGSNADGEAWSG